MVRVKLEYREPVARQTFAFYFEKPPGFHFRPGQYLDVTLVDPPETDDAGNKRSFSIASDPGAETLMIVTRMRDSAFKKTLAALPLGSEVELDGPFGVFVLPDLEPKKLVFIAGGIGVTPFLSMIRNGGREGIMDDWFLFYSNREQQDAAFLHELTQHQSRYAGFRLIATMTAPQRLDQLWEGETGRINELMLLRHLSSLTGPTYYIAGPPEMIKSTRQLLANFGVQRKGIRFEVFLGY